MAKSAEEIRDKIIDIAREQFGHYGLSKTTMDDIAAKIGMGKSSLYYYFKSKEEVFRAVLNKELNIHKKTIYDSLSQVHTPCHKIRTFFVTRMRMFRRLLTFSSALKDDYFQHFAFIQKMRAQYDRYEVDLLKDIFSEGVTQGVFSIRDEVLTSRTLVLCLKGLEYKWAIESDDRELEQRVDDMLSVLFNGIVKR